MKSNLNAVQGIDSVRIHLFFVGQNLCERSRLWFCKCSPNDIDLSALRARARLYHSPEVGHGLGHGLGLEGRLS